MTLRLTTLLTAAVLTAAPAAVTALPALAATCTTPEARTTVSVPKRGYVVLDSTGSQHVDITVAVTANGCTIGDVLAQVTSPTKVATELTLTPTSTAGNVTLYAAGLDLTAAALHNADAGTWRVKTTTHWVQEATVPADDDEADDETEDETEDESEDESGDDNGTGDDSAVTTSSHSEDESEDEGEADEPITGSAKVTVLAASSVTADATSSQLRKGRINKGRSLTVKGVLTRANWETGSNTGYAKQKVDLQFRTSKGTFKKVRSLQTRAGGAFAESVKASQDGCYRVVFAGSKTTAPAPSKAECIDVR